LGLGSWDSGLKKDVFFVPAFVIFVIFVPSWFRLRAR